MHDVALITDERRPFLDVVEQELSPLRAAFEARGLSVCYADWDGPGGSTIDARLGVLRTPWNYHLRRDDFVRWAHGVPRLLNDARTVEWNSNKRYLSELAARGVPAIETCWVSRGDTVSLGKLLDERGWTVAVVKPAESGGAFRTQRFERASLDVAQQLLKVITADCDAMVQPYLRAVETQGERSLLFFGGRFSHAVRRIPPLTTGQQGAVAADVAADELALARQVLAAVPPGAEPLLYARVDMVRDQGGLRLMELELIEPSFFCETAAGSAERFVEAVALRLSEQR